MDAPADFDMILCVCCKEAVATCPDYGIGGPVCGDCCIAGRNAEDALHATPGIGGWSDICRESGNLHG